MAEQRPSRSIGLLGATATLVGYVVGASIFILPGELAPAAGPAVFVAYLLASVPALLSCLVTAQIGCAFPASGAAYVAASRTLSPYFGFLLVWALMMGITVGVALIAYGFADYLSFFVPGLDARAVAVAVLLFFSALNLLGARLSVAVQAVMVASFVAALFAFGFGGLPHVDLANLRPLFPNGLGPVAGAAIPAYFSFIGFSMIAELAGEVEQPGRNIPRALTMSFLAVLFFYTLVPFTLVGVVPWRELGDMPAPVATAATRFLPGYVAGGISAAALLAAATSLNGILLAVSRDVYALGRDGIFPEAMGRLSQRFHSPNAAILAITAVALAGVLVGTTITAYAVVAVMSIMVVQIVSAAAVFALPRRSPEAFRDAAFRMPPRARVVCSVGLVLYSLAFIGLGISQSRPSAVLFVGLLSLGTAYYALRRRSLRARGVDLDDVLRTAVATAPEDRAGR